MNEAGAFRAASASAPAPAADPTLGVRRAAPAAPAPPPLLSTEGLALPGSCPVAALAAPPALDAADAEGARRSANQSVPPPALDLIPPLPVLRAGAAGIPLARFSAPPPALPGAGCRRGEALPGALALLGAVAASEVAVLRAERCGEAEAVALSALLPTREEEAPLLRARAAWGAAPAATGSAGACRAGIKGAQA